MGGSAPFGSFRTTPQRRQIAEVVAGMERAFTVEDVVFELGMHSPRPGVATVYRAVTAMEEAGWVERIGMWEGKALYARCGEPDHHHHLVCTSCLRVSTTTCPLESSDSLAADEGFTVHAHEVTLFGTCRECSGIQDEVG